MFAMRRARLIVFAAAAVTLGAGLFVYVTPASTNVTPAPAAAGPGIVGNETAYRSWGEDLSASAVDASGVEKDLDGNASSLIASDCIAKWPACESDL